MNEKIYKFSKNFIENLKNERLANNLTQRQIAEKMGIRTQSYQAYESGIAMPTLENFLKICLILKVTPNELFEIQF